MDFIFHPFRTSPLTIGSKTFDMGDTHKPHDLTAAKAEELVRGMAVPFELWPKVEVHILEQGSSGTGLGLNWQEGSRYYVLVEAGLGGERYIPTVTLIHEFGHIFDSHFLPVLRDEYYTIRPESRQDAAGLSSLEYIAEDVRQLLGPYPENLALHKGRPPNLIQRQQLLGLFNAAMVWRALRKEVVLWIDKTNYLVDGNWQTTDQPPVIMNGRTLLPVRAVAEAVGLNVEWDATTRKVTLWR